MERILLSEIVKVVGGKLAGACDEGCGTAYVTSVSSNSREIDEGALFVPVVGERVDAHDYIGMAFEAGAAASLTSRSITDEEVPEGKYCIKVEDTLAAVQKLAGWYRRRFDIPVVGVTGSVGKTTTKEMIAAALSGGMNVLKTQGNQNSQLGVALMMFKLEREHEAAVIEMGISEPDEMSVLADIVLPSVAVVTNIGVSHIGQLGSKENIRREKLDIVTGFPEAGGVLLMCGNDELLGKVSSSEDICTSEKAGKIINVSKKILFGSSEQCEYRAENIVNCGEGVSFDIVMKSGRKQYIQLEVPGLHNVHNAAAAMAVAEYFGIDLDAAALKLREYRPMAMRGRVFTHNGIAIIDDTYNSSPDSMKSGLAVLWDRKCTGRRFAVLADVLELGEASEELHRDVGRYIAQNESEGRVTDELVTVGKEAGFIAQEAELSAGITVNAFDGKESAIAYLKKALSEGDAALIKGSRGMRMDVIVDALTK